MEKDLKIFIRNVIIACLTGIILVAVVFFGIVPVLGQTEKPAYLDILVTPLEAKVVINGAEYRDAVYEFEPGMYTVEIALDGFQSKTIEMELKQNQTFGLYVSLTPDDGDWSYFEEKQHQTSLEALLRLYGGLIETGDVTEFAKKVSLKDEVPIEFSICEAPATRRNCDAITINYDYSKACGDNLCLIISSRRPELTDETLSEVAAKLEEKGYDLDNYKYTFVQDVNR